VQARDVRRQVPTAVTREEGKVTREHLGEDSFKILLERGLHLNLGLVEAVVGKGATHSESPLPADTGHCQAGVSCCARHQCGVAMARKVRPPQLLGASAIGAAADGARDVLSP